MLKTGIIVTGVAVAAFVGGTWFASFPKATDGPRHTVQSADADGNAAAPAPQPATDTVAPSNDASPSDLPAQQIAFLSLVNEARKALVAADNPVAKSVVIDKYTSQCKQLIGKDTDISNWIGRVEDMDYDEYIAYINVNDKRYSGIQGATIVIYFQYANDNEYAAVQNAAQSLTPAETKDMELIDKIANVKKGDRVMLSGKVSVMSEADNGLVKTCDELFNNDDSSGNAIATQLNKFSYASFAIAPSAITVLGHAASTAPAKTEDE